MRTFLTILLVLASVPVALVATDSDEVLWSEFLAWYKTYTGPPYPPDLLKAYSAALTEKGKSPAEVQASLAVLKMKGSSGNPEDMMKLHFNKVYTLHQHLFSHEPNALLARIVRNLKPGVALDAGVGQGRNAVFLAGLGWDVTGYDISDEALARTHENAAKAGVRVNAIQSTHSKFDFGKERWDLIVLTYSFVSMEDRALVSRIKESLRPGGLVLVEQPNSPNTSKGPANALFRSFDDLRVVFYEDVTDTAEWNKKPQRLGRLVAQKD